MSNLNYAFFDAFKRLDNLCKDIYGRAADNRLSVSLYIDEMDHNDWAGSLRVPDWRSDYKRLKRVRHIRNELAHSNISFSADICTQDDIDFVCSFCVRILNQTDPLALLRKSLQPKPSGAFDNRQQDLPSDDTIGRQSLNRDHTFYNTYNTYQTPPYKSGCLTTIATFILSAFARFR